jgi:zinc/manganese transport system substrate-binding protein
MRPTGSGTLKNIVPRVVAVLWLGTAVTAAQAAGADNHRITVVTTFSILADMVEHIGAEQVQVSSLVPPETDAHSFEPRPQDVKTLSQADVLVSNGLGFESWLPGLQQASGFKGDSIVASSQAQLLKAQHTVAPAYPGSRETPVDDHGHDDHLQAGHDHDHGAIDPHAWQDVRNGQQYVQAIARGLSKADPNHASLYQERAQAYTRELEQLDTELRSEFATIPADRRKIITSHDAFGYFARAYGVQFIAVAGLSGRAEVSARSLAGLVDRTRNEHITGIFVESGAGSQMVEQLARETGARVGGKLYADTLARPGQPADSYVGMMHWNASRLLQVMHAANDGTPR